MSRYEYGHLKFQLFPVLQGNGEIEKWHLSKLHLSREKLYFYIVFSHYLSQTEIQFFYFLSYFGQNKTLPDQLKVCLTTEFYSSTSKFSKVQLVHNQVTIQNFMSQIDKDYLQKNRIMQFCHTFLYFCLRSFLMTEMHVVTQHKQ